MIAWHKDKGLTVSRLKRYDHTFVLQSENASYESITFNGKQRWKIVAKVLWWIGKAPSNQRTRSGGRQIRGTESHGEGRLKGETLTVGFYQRAPLGALRIDRRPACKIGHPQLFTCSELLRSRAFMRWVVDSRSQYTMFRQAQTGPPRHLVRKMNVTPTGPGTMVLFFIPTA